MLNQKGKVKIVIEYENKKYEKVNINGKMEKIYVWIDVRDRRYALRLADYFNKYFDEQMEARVYDPVYHKKGVKCPGRLILLTDDVFRERSLSPDRILLLAEKDGINPYQSAEQIARQVLSVQEDGEKALGWYLGTSWRYRLHQPDAQPRTGPRRDREQTAPGSRTQF